jgi:arylsulfatase A-like enzyme
MNVVVIVADALHAGYLGCYGNEWIETPHLDRLAAEAVVFDQHFADRPDAAGARLGWRAGRQHLPGADIPLPSPRVSLPSVLRAAGVRTHLVRDGRQPDTTDFAAGWDDVAALSAPADEDSLPPLLEECGRALGGLAGVEHTLLWVELPTLRPPWRVPDDYRWAYFPETVRAQEDEDAGIAPAEPLEPLQDLAPGFVDPADIDRIRQLQDSYAGAVTYLDAGIGAFLDRLRQTGQEDASCVIVTSDHGLALGEHGLTGPHRPWLHDELVHVPLLVRRPGRAEAGRRVLALTQSVDLLPTLLDLFGVPVPPVHGHGLLPLLHEEQATVRQYAVSGMQAGGAQEWALRTPAWAFLLPVRLPEGDRTRRPQLYVKPDDRWEVNNVIQHHLELAEHLEQVLRGFVEATRQPGPLNPPVLRDLEAELAAAPAGSDETAAEGTS